MKYLIQTFTLLSLIFLIGCGGSESNTSTTSEEAPATTASGEIDFDGMAAELCVCMTPMMDLQEKLMELLAAGDQDAIMAMQEEALKVQQNGEACVEAMEAKYGVVEGPEAEAKATEALRKACPDFMAMMDAAAQPPGMNDMPMEELQEATDKANEQQ